MYVSVRRYEMDAEAVDELMRRVEEGFVPIISNAPGFIAYYALDAGEGVVASISIFTDQAGAEESNRLAADYVRANLASLVSNPPEITAGEVKVHKAARPVRRSRPRIRAVRKKAGAKKKAARKKVAKKAKKKVAKKAKKKTSVRRKRR